MTRIPQLFFAALLAVCLLPALAFAHEYTLSDIVIAHPWARATAGSPVNGAVYVTFNNKGKAGDRLVKAATPVADKAELHTHLMEDGVMKMRPVEGIDLGPGAPVALKPGGLHIMLFGLKEPLVQGKPFPLTLTFEKAGELTVLVMVLAVAASGPEMDHDMAGMKHDMH